MERLKLIFLCLGIIVHQCVLSQDLKLATPASPYVKKMLSNNVKDTLRFDYRMEGTQIKYTLDGTAPTQQSSLMTDGTIVDTTATLKYRSFHPDFLQSDIGVIEYFQKTNFEYSITSSPANPSYNKMEKTILNDGIFGNMDFHHHYLGYQGDTTSIQITFAKKAKIKQVLISNLVNQSAWIFGPSKIIVKNEKGRIIASKSISSDEKISRSIIHIIKIDLPKKKFSGLLIEIIPLTKIPSWHEGKDSPSWLFLDEVWVN
jgi:hypothetical protein